MKILLTGGAGYIGSHASLALLDSGHEVTIIDNLSTGNKNLIPINASFIECNINDVQISKQAFIFENAGRFKDYYQIGQLLGQGAYGEVRKCIHRTTKVIRAVKLIKKESMTEEDLASFHAEI